MAVRSVVCPIHVGRDAEIAVLRQAAATVAVREGGRTVLVGGDAGAGKSRIAAEAVHIAEAAEMHVLVGQCPEVESTAYAAVTGALRRHTRTLDDDALGKLFAGPAQLAATILPEVAATLGFEVSESAAPADLQAALWHLLLRLGADHPVLLLIEDAHWAGTDTLRLLQALAGETPTLPLWLLITYRTDEIHRRHPLTPVIAAMKRTAGVEDIVLHPLDREQQRAMLSALFAGTAVSDEFLDAVSQRTEGNPFFIEELSAVLVERGDIFMAGGDWNRRALAEIEMPLTVRETLLARLGRLAGSAQDVLRVAAVAGEHVDPRVLADASGRDTAAVDEVLVAALERQLLVERREHATSHYAFRHALLREALIHDLVGPERRAVHRRVAEAIERVHSAQLDDVAASLALHWEEAGDEMRARQARLQAARRAVADRAPVAAAEHFDRALHLLPASSPERLAILLEAAQGTYTDHDRSASSAFAREARRLAREHEDRGAEARAMRWIWQDAWRNGDSDGALTLQEEALRLVEGGDDDFEAWCLAAYARGLTLTGRRSDEARALLPRAEETATRMERWDALSQVHATRAIMAPTEEENRQATRLAIEYARKAGAPDAEYIARTNSGYIHLWLGSLDRAVEALRGSVDLAERVAPGRIVYTKAGLAWALALQGGLDEALELAEPLAECPDVPARMVALTALAEVALARGDTEAALAHASANWALAERNGEGQRVDPARSHLVRARIAAEGPAAAGETVAMLLERRWLTDHQTGCHAFISPDLAAALRLLGETRRLTELVAVLTELTEHDPNRHNRAAMAAADAELALARGQAAAAAQRFAEAAAAYALLPCPHRQARALLGAAEAALASGDAASATESARGALVVAEALDSPSLRAEGAALIAQAEVDVVLATVLLTDIVDSTSRAASAGDRAWRGVLERHHGIVRRELQRHRGREVDTAGDGFLAAFDSPARAIRCALAVVEALEAAGIPIRAGLHTGECEVLGDKLAGIAVHTAARVAGLASAGEVMVSGTVRDLVAGAGFGFESRGIHALKGVPGEWPLYTVRRLPAAPAGTTGGTLASGRTPAADAGVGEAPDRARLSAQTDP